MKITVITINYNNKLGLEKTINSVIEQTYNDIEYIIIDGGSTDGSIDIIKQHESEISYWVSETDNGIYHAMNKGVLKAKGDYLLMLNSGDYLTNDSIINQIAYSGLTADIIYGDVVWNPKILNYPSIFPDELKFSYFLNYSLGHQATFISKKVHNIVGLYDEDLKIVADWKLFLLAIFKYQLSYQHVSKFVSVCDRNGFSCLPENGAIVLKEKSKVFNAYFSQFIKEFEYFTQIETQYNLILNNQYYKMAKKMKQFLKFKHW
jgi:glycosyltransferase involved in cell wall biosynthesis